MERSGGRECSEYSCRECSLIFISQHVSVKASAHIEHSPTPCYVSRHVGHQYPVSGFVALKVVRKGRGKRWRKAMVAEIKALSACSHYSQFVQTCYAAFEVRPSRIAC